MGHKDLLDRLNEYAAQDYVPMHMPGAKRNTELFAMPNPYGLDITEIDNFDNMHHADGIIKAAFERCAHTFGAEESLYLVNGSSAGILAAICGATQKGDKVIVARNSHVSVYNAIYLNELEPIYVYPEYVDESAGICSGITAAQVENAFENGVRAIIITSPTYEGMVSDIGAIAAVAHKNGAVLIVDEAHGAHFNFDEAFPESAVKCGADLVVQSLHKTLPSFTQTAVLHMCGGIVDRKRVKMYWDMYQSTSPSYVLMAGIDRCVTILNESGKELFEVYVWRLKKLRGRLARLKNFRLLETDDISKLVIIADDGRKLYDILLQQYHIQLEMSSLKYVIAMTAVGDKEQYYERFAAAMEKIDKVWNDDSQASDREIYSESGNLPAAGLTALELPQAKSVLSIYEAMNRESERVGLNIAEGRVAAEKVCFYPPGVPLVVPGEVISKEHIRIIKEGLRAGLEVLGIEGETHVIENKKHVIEGEKHVIENEKHVVENEAAESESQSFKHARHQTKKEEVTILCLR